MSTVKMSTQHKIMDSSLALGKLEINSTGSLDISHSVTNKGKTVQDGPQTHLNGCVPLSHQVAGHKYGVDKVGILQHPDGTVLKQLQPPPRGPREMQFYSQVYAEDCSDPVLLELQQYVPKYFGAWSSPDTPAELYLKLEDVTRKFRKPCIMDVKIGQRSYDPFASQEKREQQIKKYPLMEEMGFLVLGMRIYKVNSDSYETHDQHYGRGLVKETIKDGVSKFFYNGNSLRNDAVSASIKKVEKILQWFEGQSQLHFYASSLLFVYEGSPQEGSPKMAASSPPGETPPPKARVPNDRVVEYNNNIHVMGPGENRLLLGSLGHGLSDMYALHRRGCGQGRHGDAPDDVRNAQRDELWKLITQDGLEQPNGNAVRAQQEEEGEGRRGPDLAGDVEVRMIDFAHVFPGHTQDEGYIYGLKNLLLVLQQILSE
ncbi:inositol polyphosphate multikinase [Anguilla anguilla]|uniref:inositol polyphosphate multikinase n=1 Tax=Anguilla anguilla TaxID=7936 RepID=UPI0015B300E4|nr:inositol polyphosphate multikinase [Anguilla anguilla]